jgi:hypothetical protein
LPRRAPDRDEGHRASIRRATPLHLRRCVALHHLFDAGGGPRRGRRGSAHALENFTRFDAYKENKELKYKTWRYCYCTTTTTRPPSDRSRNPPVPEERTSRPRGASRPGGSRSPPARVRRRSPTRTGRCGSARPARGECGQLQVDIDCTNVRPLATTTHSVLHELDTCYYLYPYETFEVFPDVVRSGSGGITRSLAAVGAVAFLAHAAAAAGAASSLW